MNRYGQLVNWDMSLSVQVTVKDVSEIVWFEDRLSWIVQGFFGALGAPWARPAKTIAMENSQVDFDYPPATVRQSIAIAFPRGFA